MPLQIPLSIAGCDDAFAARVAAFHKAKLRVAMRLNCMMGIA
jgi:hypothetical protein